MTIGTEFETLGQMTLREEEDLHLEDARMSSMYIAAACVHFAILSMDHVQLSLL